MLEVSPIHNQCVEITKTLKSKSLTSSIEILPYFFIIEFLPNDF